MAPALISCDGNMATRLIFSTFLVRCNGVFSSSGRLHIKYRYKHKMFHLSPFMQLSNNRSISLKFERETQVKDVKKKVITVITLTFFFSMLPVLYPVLRCLHNPWHTRKWKSKRVYWHKKRKQFPLFTCICPLIDSAEPEILSNL